MTRKGLILALTVTAAMMLAGCSAVTPAPSNPEQPCTVNCYGATPANPRSISVTGQGSVNVSPDIAVTSLGVVTRDADIGKAWDDNNARAQSVIGALQAQGVKPEDIRSDFSLYQQQKYDAFGQPTDEITYIVTHTLTVTVRDLTNVGTILGEAQAAGVNSVGGISFSLEDPDPAVSQARGLALADARARADEIAKGLGVTVGKVLSVNEYGASVPTPVDKAYALGIGGGGGSSVPIQVGTWQVSLSVNVVFEIE
jgi:uncharacterized protein YggE